MNELINCPHCGKIIPEYILNRGSKRETVTCPMCSTQRNLKDGERKTNAGTAQLYICKDCGRKFSSAQLPLFYKKRVKVIARSV